MALLWVLLTAGVTAGEMLAKGYLPPRSDLSSESPDTINIPLDLSKHLNDDKIFTDRSEIAIGINGVPPKVIDFEESVSKAIINDNLFSMTAKGVFPSFTQSTLFPVASRHSTITAGHYFDSNNLSEDFDVHATSGDISNFFPVIPHSAENSPQLIPDDNKFPIDTVDEKHSQADLFYNGVTDTISTNPTIVSSLVHNDLPDPNDYYSSLVTPGMLKISTISQKLGTMPNSHLTSNYLSDHNNRPAISHESLKPFQAPSIIPITVHEESSQMSQITTENRPERIQSHYDRAAVIVNYEQTKTPEGYAYSYATSNGIHADESGCANKGVRAKGSYSYIGDDGKLYYVEYTADENGFRPKGTHLPTAPPIPDGILKVIEQATKDKESGVYDDGSYNEEKYGYKKYQGRSQSKYKETNSLNPSTEYFNVHEDKSDIYKKIGGIRVQNKLDNLEEIHNNSLEQISPQLNNLPLTSLQVGTTKNLDIAIESNIHNTPSILNGQKNLNQASSYQYFPAQNTSYDMLSNFLPSRFSDFKFSPTEKGKQYEIYNRTIPEPFLTPYVSRKDDDLDDESDEMTLQNQYSINDKDSISTNSDYSRDENELNDNSIKTDLGTQYLKLMLGKVPEQQLHFENRQLGNDDQRSTTEANMQYTFGVVPIGFPSSSTTSETVHSEAYVPGKIQSLSQINSNEAKSYTGVYESQTTTEKISGEDFSGPQRQQGFDPTTGYHY